MGQEFIIKSTILEDKVNQLLPSQGGFQAGVDLSASTTIIPIVDLTESAEGSNLRVDLQSALSQSTAETYNVTNTTTTVINTTGYFRVFGNIFALPPNTGSATVATFTLTDGSTPKIIFNPRFFNGNTDQVQINVQYDFIVHLKAGDSLILTSGTNVTNQGSTRQLADLQGNLVNP